MKKVKKEVVLPQIPNSLLYCCIFVSWLLDTFFFVWFSHSFLPLYYLCSFILSPSLSLSLRLFFFIFKFCVVERYVTFTWQYEHLFVCMGKDSNNKKRGTKCIPQQEYQEWKRLCSKGRKQPSCEGTKNIVMNKRWHNNCCVQSINYPCDVDSSKPIIGVWIIKV